MKKLLLVTAIVFTSACGSKADNAIKEMEGFKTRMCECKDKDCAEAVNKDMKEWGKKMKDSGMEKGDLSDDQKSKVKDITKEMMGCMMKLMMPDMKK